MTVRIREPACFLEYHPCPEYETVTVHNPLTGDSYERPSLTSHTDLKRVLEIKPTTTIADSRYLAERQKENTETWEVASPHHSVYPPGNRNYITDTGIEGTAVDLLRANQPLAYTLSVGDLPSIQNKTPAPGDGGGKYPREYLARAVLYQRIHDELNSYHDLALHLNSNPEVAACFGLPDNIPNHDTFRRAWNKVYRRNKDAIDAEIADIVRVAYDEGYEHVDTSGLSLEEYDDEDAVPNLVDSEKERAYREIEGELKEIVDFDRADNSSVSREDLVDIAGYLSRRNTYAEQGVKRAEIEGEKAVDAETYRRAVRAKEREKQRTDGRTRLEPREDPSVNIHRERCNTRDWHGTLEEGVERVVELLEEEGVMGEPVPVCLDGTKQLYHKHPDGADEPPQGVYQEARFKTNYAWKNMTATAIVDGRSVVLGNISRVPGDRFFDAVRYLVDRARELVDVGCFYADAAFANTDVCRYIEHVGETYAMKKPHRRRVQQAFKEFSGKVDYLNDFTMRSDTKGITHHTNLVAVEKRGKIDVKKGEKRHQGTTQQSLADVEPEGQLSLDDLAEEQDVEYVAFVTNEPIESDGIDPAKNPIAHDNSNTAWGVAERYRKRWSIETTFRQLQYQFLAKTNSRDLGVRRFYWMMAMLLYNSWVALNLMVQKNVPTVSGERPPVCANVFLEEIAERARGWPPPD